MFTNIIYTSAKKGHLMIDDLDYLKTVHLRRLQHVPSEIYRYLFQQIDWRDRLIMIEGARGVGKTTLLLQYIKKRFGTSQEALYISLDNLWFSENSLYDVAEYHSLHGGTHLFIDEVHYYKDWQQIIKNIYDDFPDLHIVYTGSSLLKLESGNADLSRRQMIYHLKGLSFREFLEFEGKADLSAVDLQTLLNTHSNIAADITAGLKILPLFETYLRKGYYPFYKEIYEGYEMRIEQTINQVLETDYPCVEDVSFATIQKTKKMLMILARSTPQTPNMSQLYKELETDRNQGLKMLGVLARSGILQLLSSKKETLKNMSKPDKIYCDNTNIMAALVTNPDIGCVRETFFLNQIRSSGHDATYPAAGDFLVDDHYLFEVGGHKKSYEQIKDIPDSFLAVDGLEVGFGNRIPLWMFGLLY